MRTMTSLLEMTAGDLMSRDVVTIDQDLPPAEAAHVLLENRIGGAPVVDADGRCIGVLSATDFVRRTDRLDRSPSRAVAPLPPTCSFLERILEPAGTELAHCTLPPGACPVQTLAEGPDGRPVISCGQPHCVLVDWQVVTEELPPDAVRCFMTPDPVTVLPEVPIRTLARLMIDAHIHRVIVVDEQDRPIGIVTGTDILAAVAYAEGGL